ncbi:alpha/beta hydrolase [Chthonobacter rhizosphaerae]|uniref:alpha/beta hydrolase n=1 Tax=Chthonobacter rhizosphaerae TaxID=2735553 RepID=UPI0015EF328C|nr:dienelactone hydrolase family protein [Chthonobacter rhizosphaerae]
MSSLDGPRLAPAAGGQATGLVVLVHGYGADGNDLIDIGRAFAPHLPSVAFASPHAPSPCGMSAMGREWFPLTFRDPAEYRRGVQAAGPALAAFLDAELARLGLAGDRLVLVGFSQGTMMALHAGLRRTVGPAAIVGYSGLLADPEDLSGITARPPVTLIHGDRDDVLPIAFMHRAAAALGEAGVPCAFHVCPGVAHGIDQRGLALGLSAIRSALSPA